MSVYKGLSRAQLSYDYLHTNSTTHEFLFGALAELLDNARDASATKINIYSVPDQSLRGGYMLCFLDDGQGMSPGEAYDIITFGKSTKKATDSQLIGMYGNGLKSGSMRIGNDFILFSKKGPTLTCVFLSRSFHEAERLDEIIVPMPSFDSQTKKPLVKTPREKEKHLTEMELILKYSPFKTEAQFMKEFDKIESSSGTLVIVYNLKLLDTGEPELDVKNQQFDIILSNPDMDPDESDDGLMPERKSFRAYTSILYVEPRMRVYIQGRKVRTKRLINTLYKPRNYKYTSARFKARSEAEAKRADEEAKIAEARAREAESKAKNLELKYSTSVDKEHRAELRRAQVAAVELKKDAQFKKATAERKAKYLRDPKQLSFVFGVNIENRSRDGMFVYNSSRLIKMYQKVGPQADGGVFCSGIVGVVDVPYLVLEPTHNKQDFADAKEYRHLQQAMGDHMLQYWKDLEIAQQGVSKFWESFGYVSPNWRDLPSFDPKFIRKRAAVVHTTLQCDLCLKWRVLPFSTNNIGRTYPDDWVCSMNPDPAHNRCSSGEEKMNLPEGVLKKSVKTREQREKELEKEIKKKQSQLDKIQHKYKQSSKSRDKSESEESENDVDSNEDDDKNKDKPVSWRGRDSKDSYKSHREDSRGSKHHEEMKKHSKRSSLQMAASHSSKDKKASVHDGLTSRPGRRRGMADSGSEDSDSGASSSDSGVLYKDGPPAKKKAQMVPSKNSSAKYNQSRSSPSRTLGSSSFHANSRKQSDVMRDVSGASLPKSFKIPRMKSSTTTKDSDVESSDEESAVLVDNFNVRRRAEVGTKVEVRIEKKWLTGLVVDMNRSKEKWKVVLDKQRDSYQWFDRSSKELRVVKAVQEEASETRTSDVESETSTDKGPPTVAPSTAQGDASASEAPSSSTVLPPSNFATVINEEIANGYRTCLRYFLPPQWVMDKDAVSGLSVADLAGFPLDDFFDHYEKGLRKLVSSFQQEAISKQQDAEVSSMKLSNVRKMIAKLLKSMNDEFDIDAEADTDQVDELLAACLKTALSQSGAMNADHAETS